MDGLSGVRPPAGWEVPLGGRVSGLRAGKARAGAGTLPAGSLSLPGPTAHSPSPLSPLHAGPFSQSQEGELGRPGLTQTHSLWPIRHGAGPLASQRPPQLETRLPCESSACRVGHQGTRPPGPPLPQDSEAPEGLQKPELGGPDQGRVDSRDPRVRATGWASTAGPELPQGRAAAAQSRRAECTQVLQGTKR